MKTWVVYDSQFGNTEIIARAISATIPGEVILQRPGEAERTVTDLDLIVVGSPTQGGRPTAAISTFISGIPTHALDHVAAATFDTRVAPKWPLRLLLGLMGYAAPRIGRQLHARGAQVVLEPEGFVVEASEGPLKSGEEQRAAEWAKKLLASLSDAQRLRRPTKTPKR
jgi:flavodoxin